MYKERCYGFSKQTATWSAARDRCEKISTGYNLVVIKDEKENNFLQTQIQNRFRNEEFWIGLKDTGTNTRYEWADTSSLEFGEVFRKPPWNKEEPNSVSKLVSMSTLCSHRE